MQLGDFLFPTVIGFVFLISSNVTRFSLHRFSGYNLLFGCVGMGLVLHIIAYYVYNNYTCSSPLYNAIPEKYHIHSTAAFLVLIVPNIINCFYRKRKAITNAAMQINNHVGVLIYDAIDNDQLIQLVLKNGTVYIGDPANYGLKNDAKNSEIAIVVYSKGHIDKKTEKIIIDRDDHTDQMLNVLKKPNNKLSYWDFKMIIPVSDIASAQLCIWDIFYKHNSQN